MATVNSVNNIAAMLAISSPSLNDTVEVLGYTTPNDGGGGTFYWDTTSGAHNGGTIFVPGGGTGACWRRLYGGFIDVKWFGCKGDNTTNDTANFQAALNFVSAQLPHKVDLYISQGTYVVYPPSTGNDCLFLNLSSFKAVNIYGDGANISQIRYNYNGNTTNYNIFRIKGHRGVTAKISDFGVVGNQVAGQKYGKGLVLDYMQYTSIENISTLWVNTGIELVDVLCVSFKNISLFWGIIGLNALSGTEIWPPNVLSFTSCAFGANEELGVKLDNLYGMHNVFFNSCSIEGNGLMHDPSTGGISTLFTGVNGASGLTVENCYFEANQGGFDVKLATTGHGSHTFSGNTFNRISSTAFTEHNILIDGNGQTPQRNFGLSKTKVVIQGNGFLIANTYSPDPSRKPIKLINTNPDYWQYDIVEQGNEYMDLDDFPDDFPDKMPQTSEYNRVKAYGLITEEAFVANYPYNTLSAVRNSIGNYTVQLANVPRYIVNVVVTPYFFFPNTPQPIVATVANTVSNYFDVCLFDMTGSPIDCAFHFVAF